MEMFSQYQYQNEQMMYQAMQLQQQAYLYSSYMPQQMIQTDNKSEKKKSKRSYIQCDLWKRQALIDKVDKDGLTIKDAAKVLDINYSTAKHIMKVYRQTGEVETKIMIKRKNRDGKVTNEYEEDCEMVLDEQYPSNETQDVGCYFNGQFQLPIDINMINPCFYSEPLSIEEKQRIRAFFFNENNESQ